MTDEKAPTTETVEEPTKKVEAPETQEEPFDKDRAMKLIEKLRAEEKDWKKERKELEALKAKEAQRAEADMTELQKAQARAEKAEKDAAELRLAQTRRSIADEVGLPPVLAARLQGSTPEEMKADAETLLKSLPETTQPKPKLNVTNPAEGEKVTTDKDRRAFLFG
jgi:ATPase subunit of ABC transporter with duplicated ATPase domains